MTSDPTIEAETRATWKARKVRGKGTTKPPPSVVFSGANILGDIPHKRRPSRDPPFDQKVADRLCDWVGEGRSMRSFCLQEDTPHVRTVAAWLNANPAFAQQYARAKDEGMDVLAELAMDAATSRLAPEEVQAAKLAFDARRWYASKIAPRRYADKLQVQQEISGVNGGPVEIRVQALLGLVEDPAIADRLADHHLAAIREVAALLAAPAPQTAGEAGGPIIEAGAEPVKSDE